MSSGAKQPGAIRRFAAAAKQKIDDAAEMRAEKAARVEATYGRVVALGNGQNVEIYEKGYVRILRLGSADPDRPETFERLRGIAFTHTEKDKSAGGRAVASALTLGVSRLASNEKIVSSLTVVTDKKVHTLGGLSLGDGLALETAGKTVLEAQKTALLSVTQAASPADQLRDLAALHEGGVLTDEEFADAKAKLLGQI